MPAQKFQFVVGYAGGSPPRGPSTSRGPWQTTRADGVVTVERAPGIARDVASRPEPASSHMSDTPLPEYPLAPECLDLRWHSTRMLQNYRGTVRRSQAEPTEAFRETWHTDAQAASELRELGFQFRFGSGEVLHWGVETATSVHRVEAAVASAAARLSSSRRVAQDLRDRLQAEVSTHAWAVHRDKLATARRLLSGSLMGWTPQHEARELLREFERGLKRAQAAVATAVAALDPVIVARFRDDAVRVHVHNACRVMSRADQDWASTRNEMGWSKATSARGHWIAELNELTPDLAAVGYMLAEVHAKQFRRGFPELATALFGAAA